MLEELAAASPRPSHIAKADANGNQQIDYYEFMATWLLCSWIQAMLKGFTHLSISFGGVFFLIQNSECVFVCQNQKDGASSSQSP